MELFYDLVFVYAIANMTHLIHHLDNGVTKPFAFFQYIIVLIVLVNVWMYQTIYCNRLGQDKPKDWMFLLLDMFFMLHLSNAISSDIRGTFVPFCIYLSLLTFSLAVQYATELTRNDIDKNVIYLYIVILTIKGGLVLAAGFMPFEFGVFVALAGIILGWLLPMFLLKKMKTLPTNFPHLVERITLLVIITFGEMIVDISSYFIIERFEVMSIPMIAIVGCLFIYYITEFDRLINHCTKGSSGGGIIYSHYLVFPALGVITVMLDFLNDADANRLFVVISLYIAIAVLYIGIILNSFYNKSVFKPSKQYYIIQAAVFICGFTVALMLRDIPIAVSSVTAVMTMVQAIMIYNFSVNGRRQQ